MKTSQQNKILNLLDDGAWHCTSEMAALYMVDYRRRLVDLKEKGWQLESRRCTKHPHPMKEWHILRDRLATTRLLHKQEIAGAIPAPASITVADFLKRFPSKREEIPLKDTLF